MSTQTADLTPCIGQGKFLLLILALLIAAWLVAAGVRSRRVALDMAWCAEWNARTESEWIWSDEFGCIRD